MSLRVLIADDEAPARRKVRAFLAGKENILIMGEAANGLETVDAIQRLRPDLVFLDIQMPGMNAFEVISAIGADAMPAIVLVTAYDKYAIEAFEVEAIDYLLKPVREDRFDRALKRAIERINARNSDADRFTRLLDRVQPDAQYLQRLVVREGERLFLVPTNQIVRASADGNYVCLHTSEGSHMVRETISRLETRLDPKQFARIHRSEIVNIDCIKEIRAWFHGDYIIVLRNGQECHLSRRFKSRLLDEHLK
jgi:two-component system, LytTR family, response regulator